jgi:hypothetical protein
VTSGTDSAIFAEDDAGHLVIQRNLIEHPRGGSNDWESGHPNGPQAISLTDSRGGNIIRYNTIRSTEDHGFNDAIGGSSNFSFKGSPNRDSDIYGNLISNCWDDCIESEGANANVRIWSNYIHHTFTHVATASTSMGPLYIFRNVFGESRISHQDRSGGQMIKTGGREAVVNGEKVSTLLGYRFIFHNTALQPNGGLDVFTSHELHNAVTRNNIFYARGRTYPPDRGEPRNDFKNDLTGGFLGGGFVQSMFLPSDGNEWFLAPTMKKMSGDGSSPCATARRSRSPTRCSTCPIPPSIRRSGCRVSMTTSPATPRTSARTRRDAPRSVLDARPPRASSALPGNASASIAPA